jgi:HK97 family phage major capsid protein
MKTLLELRDERARKLTEIDDILRTAVESGWTDDDRARHDSLVAELEGDDGLDAQIARAEIVDADTRRVESADARRSRYMTVNVPTGGDHAVKGDRHLDDLLWATTDVVRAGTFDRTGRFHQHGTAVNQVEQVVIRSESGSDIRVAPRISEFRPEDRDVVRTFQKLVGDMVLFGLLVDKDAKSSRHGFEVARSHRIFKDRFQYILRAMDVDTSGEGGTWVPTGIGADYHEKVRAAGKVSALFPRIDLPTNPWKWPIEGADATAYRIAEPTGDSESKMTASTPGTVAATFDAEIFGARALFSRSLDADSAVAILPYATRKLVQAFVDAEEKAILDGDTDGTHMDTDANSAGATDARWAWDGLRKKAIAQTVVTATTTTAANLLLIRGGMGKWGVNPADLAYIVGVSAYHDLIGDTNLLTVDKMGPNATILNGQVGSVGGVPVIVSEHVRENLNATGVHDNITTTKTYNLCVNRNEWAMGQRMALDVEVDDSIYRETYQRVVVGFMREDFQHIGDAAANDDTAIAYNVTP